MNAKNDIVKDRRPLTSRSSRWATGLSRWLAGTSMTPNQISFLSMVAAACGLLFLLLSARLDARLAVGSCLLLAAAACQLRLLCNLMDGMVAIEAGKRTVDGAVWNELPDRVADILLLAGLGYACSSPVLGWIAAALAILVAYVRELGKGIDGVVDFSGPMAKPHRMALETAALVLAGLLSLVSDRLFGWVDELLQGALWVLCAGSLLTVLRRSRRLLARLAETSD